MSLIYSAISSLENKPGAEGVPAEPRVFSQPAHPTQSSSARWIYAAGVGTVAAVVIGGAALAVVRERSKEVSPPLAASTPVQASRTPQINASVPVRPDSLAESVPLQQESMSAPQAVPPTPVTKTVELTLAPSPKEHGVAEKPAALAVSSPQLVAAKPARHVHPATAAVAVEPAQPKPAVDDLNRLATAAKQAIDAGNKDEAESALKQLAAHLPPESVTMLRLRAWQALRNNEQSRAMMLYGQIVERLPADESASINLAVLNWKAGQQEEARRIVGMLAERRPDSETVRRYVAQFGERR